MLTVSWLESAHLAIIPIVLLALRPGLWCCRVSQPPVTATTTSNMLLYVIQIGHTVRMGLVRMGSHRSGVGRTSGGGGGDGVGVELREYIMTYLFSSLIRLIKFMLHYIFHQYIQQRTHRACTSLAVRLCGSVGGR